MPRQLVAGRFTVKSTEMFHSVNNFVFFVSLVSYSNALMTLDFLRTGTCTNMQEKVKHFVIIFSEINEPKGLNCHKKSVSPFILNLFCHKQSSF